MTCSSCVATVEKLLKEVPGIENAKVSLEKNEATLEMEHHVALPELKGAFKNYPKYSIEEVDHSSQMHAMPEDVEAASFWITYKPILLIFGYLLGLTLLIEVTSSSMSLMRWMSHFMAGFFIVFSFFKMLDLTAFASSYSTYDIVAKRWYGWGYVYPFVELTLGILFLLHYQMVITNSLTFIVMGVSSIGVIQSLMAKRKIRCACLGAVFNLPMSTITLIEDLLMVGMSAVMIIYHL